MYAVIRIALTGLLLSAAALCLFGCWGIRELVLSERRVAVDVHETAQAATSMATGVATVAYNVDGLVGDARPRIALALDNAGSALGRLDQTGSELASAGLELQAAAGGLRQTVALINEPCTPGKACGTLADVNRTLGSVRLAAGQVTAFSRKEEAQLGKVNEQETAIAAATKDDLGKLGMAIDSITLLTENGDMAESFAHLNTTTGALAGMATDTQQSWHSTLHPKWPKRVWSAATGVGVSVAKFFF